MSGRSPYHLLNHVRRGERLSPDDIEWFIQGFTRGEIADYQMSAFLMATAIRGLDEDETAALTEAIVHSGEQWLVRDELGFVADKHSTGGVGDKISLVLAPWVAACGVRIGMLSGRGLGHTGGTLDKIESIPGFRAHLTREELVRTIAATGCAIATSTVEIAPADRRMYALRDVTGTVESLPLITASVMSKKIAFGASFLLLDVKTGSGAFMPSYESAHALARALIGAAKGSGMRVEAMITNMDRPLGRTIGNANEMIEAMSVLAGKGPRDVQALARAQGERILLASGKFDRETGRAALDEALASGAALAKAKEWITAQGGDPSFIDTPAKLGQPRHRLEVHAPRGGLIDSMDGWKIGMIAVHLGAGRTRQDDAIDPTAGIELIATQAEPVRSGAPIAILSWSGSSVDGPALAKRFLDAIAITDDPSPSMALVQEILTEEDHDG